jgi:hypothetical protein
MFMIKNWIIYVFLVLMLSSGQLLAEDRMKLNDTSIVGSKELPKVTYIVPWKNSNISEVGLGSDGNGDSFKQSMNALDRGVFRKKMDYYSLLEGTGREAQQ